MPWRPTNPDRQKPKRENSYNRGYGKKWQKLRRRFLMEHPLCAKCGRAAQIVDHITPHRLDSERLYDERNLQSLCKPCHDRKTGSQDSRPLYEYQ